MSAVKEKAHTIIDRLPDDSSLEGIAKELVFNTMIERGLNDVAEGRTTAHELLKKDIKNWQK